MAEMRKYCNRYKVSDKDKILKYPANFTYKNNIINNFNGQMNTYIIFGWNKMIQINDFNAKP